MEPTKLEGADAKDWNYRGEGALNIVLAYSGTSPQFVGKVLRIQKSGKGKEKCQSPLTDLERIMWTAESELASCERKEMVDHLYGRIVMGPLLDPSRVDPGAPVIVSNGFLTAVERNTNSLRPPWRVAAARIDPSSSFAFLMSDHSLFPPGGPCLSVEVKPKCGFLPTSEFVDDKFWFKKSITRYRMHQLLKLKKNEVSEISEYDPLDLFSGEKKRIHKAIKNLFETPQNNFRVFLDGMLIFGGLGGGIGKTSIDDTAVFSRKLESFMCEDGDTVLEKFIELVGDTLRICGALDRLLEVQKLDKLDIEGAIHAYYNLASKGCSVCRESKDSGKFRSLHSLGADESMKIVKEYLIAGTAKDCSIMISYKSGRVEGSSSHVTVSDKTFCFKVNYIDLDLKSVVKMEDYFKLDHKILENYSKTELQKQVLSRHVNTDSQQS